MSEIIIERTKSNIPCIWESGGAYTNTANCVMVCNMYGNPKKPVYITKHGPRACGDHALIPIRENDYTISMTKDRYGMNASIYKIIKINDNNTCEVERINQYIEDKYNEIRGWTEEYDPMFDNVIQAGKEKMNDYHCRNPYYIIEGEI